MIVSEKKLENSRMELQIEIPVNIIDLEYEKVFIDFQKNAKIDGFRKGKVPLDIIKKRFQSNVDAEVSENLIESAYIDATKGKELYPISKPEVQIENKIDKEKPFIFTIKFDVSPTIELGNYKNLSVKENDCKIEDPDIEEEIQRLREKYATISKKGEGEKVEKGNFIRAELRRIDNIDKDNIASVEPVKVSIIVGKDKTDYGIDEDAIGMKVNEEKEIIKKYPKDHFDKDLAGQKVKYLLKITEINTLTLPEPDNEFAKDLGEFSSIDEVKIQIRKDFENYVKDKIRKSVNDELMGKIIESSKFDIPESMIAREMENLKSRIETNMGLAEGKLDELFSKGALNKDEFLKKVKEEANVNIKSTLVLLEIAKIENIKVPEDKYKDIINDYSKRYNKDSAEIEKLIEKNGSKENIETELIINSAFGFIYKNANIKKQKPVSFEEFRKQ